MGGCGGPLEVMLSKRFEPLLAQKRHWDREAFSHSKNESFMLSEVFALLENTQQLPGGPRVLYTALGYTPGFLGCNLLLTL